ncbi:hypothetical protein [Lutibacter sp.]|uniref:hypothetical protein n=1 Tax=Lutibacter sp. TaxID=1925666 RepID=UPI0025B88888|nr:hypothetical protein [Lutibacter sp.]MCF6181064.1 hypothetical protein [Lutibacter sp.]
MKKQFLNLGKALSKAEQKQINGGTFDDGNPGPYYDGIGSSLGDGGGNSCPDTGCGWIVDHHTGAQLVGTCLVTTNGSYCVYR